MPNQEESVVEDEKEQSRDRGSISMGVRRVMVSSGDAKWICEIGGDGEEHDSGSAGLAMSSPSSEPNRSSDKVL
jgi:hypothetical protein